MTQAETIKYSMLLYNFKKCMEALELLKKKFSSSILELGKHINHILIEVN